MKINWGAVLVDLVIIVIAAFTHEWWLLLLTIFTGSYKLT